MCWGTMPGICNDWEEGLGNQESTELGGGGMGGRVQETSPPRKRPERKKIKLCELQQSQGELEA